MNRTMLWLAATGLAAITATVACATTKDAMTQSPNFKDGVFHNTHTLPSKSIWKGIKMRLTTDWSDWPEWVDITPGPKPEATVGGEPIKVTFINHATFLVQTGGYNILTDPIYSMRCSPVTFAGPKRVHQPGIKFEDLPKIDAVLISHDHYDHLDTVTLKKLIKRDDPKILMGLGVGKRLEGYGSSDGQLIELDWWQPFKMADDLTITFAEVQHFSGRYLHDRNSTLWGGFVIETPAKKIYFGGDSGYADHYVRTFERFGAMDLALIPIGAYAPRSFMGPIHMDPKQAVQAHIDLKARKSIGMHFGTFQLTAETRDEPERLLASEKAKASVADEAFVTLLPGASMTLP